MILYQNTKNEHHIQNWLQIFICVSPSFTWSSLLAARKASRGSSWPGGQSPRSIHCQLCCFSGCVWGGDRSRQKQTCIVSFLTSIFMDRSLSCNLCTKMCCINTVIIIILQLLQLCILFQNVSQVHSGRTVISCDYLSLEMKLMGDLPFHHI